MNIQDDTFNDLLHYMTADPTTGDLPVGEAEAAKNRVGQLIANLVVAKTAASIITANAQAITAAADGDRSIAKMCASFQTDCEMKLERMTEGWDANPTDTQFDTSRTNLLGALTATRDAAEKIRDISDRLLRIFDTEPIDDEPNSRPVEHDTSPNQ